MDIVNILNQVMPLFVILAVGYCMLQFGLVDREFQKGITNICVDVMVPGMLISSMCSGIGGDDGQTAPRLIAAGLICLALCIVCGAIFSRLTSRSIKESNVYFLAATYSNFGLVGYGLVSSLMGVRGLFYATMFLFPFMATVNSLGVIIMQRGYGGATRINWRRALLNSPVIGTLFALTIYMLQIKLPDVVLTTASYLSKGLTPLGMMLVGMALSGYGIKGLFSDVKLYALSFIRLVAMPFLCFFVLYIMGIRGEMAIACAIPLAVPAPATVAIMAEKYEGDSELGARVILITTLFAVVTMPAMVYALGRAAGM